MISVQLGLLGRVEKMCQLKKCRGSCVEYYCASKLGHGLARIIFWEKVSPEKQTSKTYLTNFWRTFVMSFAEWAILLLGSLKVRALCAMYLASQINAERRLWTIRSQIHLQ